MKDNQENKQQQRSGAESKRVETPEPPQRKDPMNESEANRDGDEKSQKGDEKSQSGESTDRAPSPQGNKSTADRKPGTPSNSEQEPPTTTTNRRSY